MKKLKNQGLCGFSERSTNYTDNQSKLWKYLRTLSLAPQVHEHGIIAARFGVKVYTKVFKDDADYRFLKVISEEPTTASNISKKTGLKQKYLCQIKRRLEKLEVIMIAYLGQCPITKSKGVQFLKLKDSH